MKWEWVYMENENNKITVTTFSCSRGPSCQLTVFSAALGFPSSLWSVEAMQWVSVHSVPKDWRGDYFEISSYLLRKICNQMILTLTTERLTLPIFHLIKLETVGGHTWKQNDIATRPGLNKGGLYISSKHLRYSRVVPCRGMQTHCPLVSSSQAQKSADDLNSGGVGGGRSITSTPLETSHYSLHRTRTCKCLCQSCKRRSPADLDFDVPPCLLRSRVQPTSSCHP